MDSSHGISAFACATVNVLGCIGAISRRLSRICQTSSGRITFAALRNRIRLVEEGFANLVFGVMVLLPVLAILGRLVGRGSSAAITIAQHLTLWIAFLGALLCTRDQRHLSLSTSELLSEKHRHWAKLFTHSVAAATCALLAYASYKLVKADMASPEAIFASVPVWVGTPCLPMA